MQVKDSSITIAKTFQTNMLNARGMLKKRINQRSSRFYNILKYVKRSF